MQFSSLSESGFIPTIDPWCFRSFGVNMVLISFREWLHSYLLEGTFERLGLTWEFSSLSESGFIPTEPVEPDVVASELAVLISFREWLHSYMNSFL